MNVVVPMICANIVKSIVKFGLSSIYIYKRLDLIKHNQSEKKLLLLIKIVPIAIIILFASIIIISSLVQNKIFFDKEIEKLKITYTDSSKQRVKEEVLRVYQDIINEKKTTESKLKENIKARVNEAHAIATRIYEENSHKSKNEIIKLIKAALRDIRFNDNRGYFFVYELKGKTILLPPNENLEGKNLWDLKDAKGTHTIRGLSNIVRTKNAGFYSWWWYKPGDKTQQYKKIGYAKHFKAFDWFIGTGEYVKDFEKNIQESILQRIHKLKYGKNGYVFVVDKEGVYLSHVKKKNIGVKRLELTDTNGFKITREIIKMGQKGDGYVRYIGTIKPSTGKPAEKITYVKGFADWNWAIGSGTYISDLDELIKEKEQELEKLNEREIVKILLFFTVITFIFIILSILFTRVIQARFLEYQNQVENEIHRNRQKDEIMFQQSKMAALGEMLENIAHQWRQPLSSISMQASGLQLKMMHSDIDKETTNKKLSNIVKSTKYLSQTIDDFRNFFSSDKERKEFNLKDTFIQTLKIIDNKLKNHDIELIKDISDVYVNGYNNELIQVLMNILNNASDALNDKDSQFNKIIKIDIYEDDENGIIKIQDNGGGIDRKIINKIFEPYFTTKHKSQGTGIGLYMSREIVMRHMNGNLVAKNSKFSYDDIEYFGAEFIITIPKN